MLKKSVRNFGITLVVIIVFIFLVSAFVSKDSNQTYTSDSDDHAIVNSETIVSEEVVAPTEEEVIPTEEEVVIDEENVVEEEVIEEDEKKEDEVEVSTTTSESTTTTNETTPTPEPTKPVHVHNFVITQKATCASNGVETCSCGETRSIPAKDHQMVVRDVPETGHVEQMTFIKTVDDYEVREVTTWGCCRCGFTTTSYAGLEEHQAYPGDCFGMSCWFQTTKQKVKVGSHEETTYENRWVVDTPATIIYVCEVCGYQAW